MSTVKDLAQLGKLVALQHGWAAAKAFKAHALSDGEREIVSKNALDLLRALPAGPMPVAQIAAALAVQLEKALSAPVQLVAGTLAVEHVPVLAAPVPTDDATLLDPAFAGHAWVMIGETIIDIALFRLAYSAQGPARLARHVDLAFGPGKALFVDGWKHAARLGLGYRPQCVPGTDTVTQLMGGAYRAILAARG